MKMLHAVAGALALCACGFGPSVFAQADTYPNKPIKFISGFAAGGSSDQVTRAIATSLSAVLGQAVVVENRPGVAGTIGMDAVTNAQPDGYTIGMLSNTTINSLHFQSKKLNIPERFIPVGSFTSNSILLVVNPKLIDVKTLPELVTYLRRHPGTPFTSAGHGGLGHLGLELLAQEQDLKIMHVAYRGTAPAMNDVLAGQVAGMFAEANFALPHIQSGKLRAIITVSPVRAPHLPDLPTALELGYKSLLIDSVIGVIMPPRTPQPLVDRMRQALKAASESASYTEAASKAGNARYFVDSPDYKVWLENEFARWGEVIRKGNISTQ